MKKSSLKITSESNNKNDLAYALVTVENELKVCLLLNNVFRIGLSLAEDIIIKDKLGTRSFRKYIYEDDDSIEKYILVVNKNAGNILFKELKQVDFIFIVKSSTNQQSIENLIPDMRTLNVFTVINKLDPSQIKKYDSLDE